MGIHKIADLAMQRWERTLHRRLEDWPKRCLTAPVLHALLRASLDYESQLVPDWRHALLGGHGCSFAEPRLGRLVSTVLDSSLTEGRGGGGRLHVKALNFNWSRASTFGTVD